MKILKYFLKDIPRNFSGKKSLSFLLVFSLLFVVACNTDDEDSTAPLNESSIEQIITALGGTEVFNKTKTVQFTIDGTVFEYEQEVPTEPNPVNTNTHRLVLSTEFNARKLRLEYEYTKFQHPFVYEVYDALIVVNDKKGSISGEYNWSSFYFGTTEPLALHSSRIEATLKNLMMSNPLEMVNEVLKNGDMSTVTKDREFIIPTRVSGLNISFVIDPKTHLPLSANIMEDDYIQGDVLFQVEYEDWVEVSGLKYPSKIVYTLDGMLMKTEELSNIEFGIAFDEDHFTPEPADQIAYSEENADNGIYRSQWYHRWLGFGIPLDQLLNNGAMALGDFDLSSVGIGDQKIGPNLKIIGRPDTRTWSVVAKTDEGLVIFDAPINAGCTRSILNTVENVFPGEPILAGVLSHTHHDHCGGLRELAYDAGRLLVGESGVDFTQKSIDSKHTLRPDNLALDPKPITVEAVTGVTSLANGAVEIHLLKPDHSHAGPHATDMVFMYVPEYEAVIVADQIWLGGFMAIYDQLTYNTLTPPARVEMKKRAKYLLDYIEEKELVVSKVIAIHGGVGTYETLERVAE